MSAFVTAPGGTGELEDPAPEPDGEPPDGDEPVPGARAGAGSGVCAGAEAVEAPPPHDADSNNSVPIDNMAATCKLKNRQNDFD